MTACESYWQGVLRGAIIGHPFVPDLAGPAYLQKGGGHA